MSNLRQLFPCVALVFLALSCASGSKSVTHAPHVDWEAPAVLQSKIKPLWTKKLRGYVSDLAISGNGKGVFVATLPNTDRPDGERKNFVRYFSAAGKLLWQRELATQVKSLALGPFGSLAVANTYDNELIAWGTGGKLLWKREASCSPIFLHRMILCYHDDDPEPGIAFEYFDRKGKLVKTVSAESDVLALKVDEKNGVLMAEAGGRVVLLDADFHVAWGARVPGEIADIALSSSKVAVLYGASGAQKIALVGDRGKVTAEVSPSGHVDQIFFSGETLFIAGNGESGQYMSVVSAETPMRELWRKGVIQNAHYSPGALPWLESSALFDFESEADSGPQTSVLELSSAGDTLQSIPVAREGTYLYLMAASQAAKKVVVADDEGGIAVYRVK